MRRVILSGLSIIALCAACRPVWGFNGAEHRRVSNLALELNLKLLEDQIQKSQPGAPDGDRLRQSQAVLQSLLDPKDGIPDYGKLVASVDHYYMAMKTRDGVTTFKGHEYFLDCKSVQRGLTQGNSCRWTAWARRLRAVHTNDLHFQEGAQRGIGHFHQEALKAAAEASDEKGLQKAFILNAIADHLIQDFLAPGHAATPRSNFHDVASASIHDQYNEDGLPFQFQVDTSGWTTLRNTVDVVDELAGKEKNLADLSDQLKEFLIEAPRSPQTFKGDNLLDRNKAQELYMLLLTARSSRDLVESFLDKRPVDKVQSADWVWEPALADQKVDNPTDLKLVHTPQGKTPSGRYELGSTVAAYTNPKGISTRALMAAFSRPAGSSASFMVDLDYISGTSPPQGAIMYKNDKGELEDAVKYGSWQYVSPGASYYRSPGLNAYDVHVSTLFPLESQDLAFSIRVGLGSYRHAGERNVRLNGGVGVGRGFGLVYGEFRFDRSYVARSGGRLHGRWAPSLGLRALLPMSWPAGIYRRISHKPPYD